jgi:hypothetical protein
MPARGNDVLEKIESGFPVTGERTECFTRAAESDVRFVPDQI